MAEAGSQSSSFLRELASSDVQQRQKAYETLRLFLTRGAPFGELELMKLWKGLFYCMWMTSNPLPQQQLAQDYASLVTSTLSRANVMPFIDSFWQTMAREWMSIDRLRLDKYLLLCRLMLRSAFRYLVRTGFDGDEVTKHNLILEKTPLNIDDMKIPNGLRYHVLDVYTDELESVRDDAGEGSITKDVLEEILQPVQSLWSKTRTSTVRKRATETLSDDRLAEWGLDVKPNKKQAPISRKEEADFEGFD